jgi:hypothetical protein
MTYTLNHRWGESDDGDSIAVGQLAELLAELDQAEDPEHGDVSVCNNESGVIISVFAGDRELIVIEDGDDAFHMTGVEREAILGMLSRFTSGEDSDLLGEWPWIPGYGS